MFRVKNIFLASKTVNIGAEAVTFDADGIGSIESEEYYNLVIKLKNFTPVEASEAHVFQNGSTAGNGSLFHNVDDLDGITFDIAGTSTAQVYQFRGIGPGGNDNLITGYRTEDSFGAKGTSVKGETWQVPIKGLTSFYVKLVSVSGGTSVVTGKF